jgi:predicted metal-dependent phosphoesterase TrpH
MPGCFRIDLHVHTGRYSACAETVAPQEVAARARAAGLHAVVLTDHDMLWELEELLPLRAAAPEMRLFRGIECSTSSGHLVVIGLDDAGALHRGIDFAEAVRIARRAGAAVILAHPYRDGQPEALPLGEIDALEIASTSFSQEESLRSIHLARSLGKPQVAASDAHALSRIGWAYTSFPRLPADERGLAEMIRAGEGRPEVPRPFPS